MCKYQLAIDDFILYAQREQKTTQSEDIGCKKRKQMREGRDVKYEERMTQILGNSLNCITQENEMRINVCIGGLFIMMYVF